jgi:hypothetical protein
MSEDLISKIKKWNDMKYGNIDYTDRTIIILKTLKPEGVTTASKVYRVIG